MLRIKLIAPKKIWAKIALLIAVLSLVYVFSNTLIFTNKMKLYFSSLSSQKSLFNEFNSSTLMEIDLLKSHINNALPIVKIINGTQGINSSTHQDLRWIVGLFTGFDIKNPRTILSSQVLLMKPYDARITTALVSMSESSMITLLQEEQKDSEVTQNTDPIDEGKENIPMDPYEKEDTAENNEILQNVAETTIDPTNPKGYDFAGNIYVKNETSINLDIAKLLNEKLNIRLEANKPQLLIIHTHTSESYTPTKQNYYVPSDTDRTEDPRFNVVRVGEEIAKGLREKGINVIHDKTIHDYPSYNGSYKSSLQTLEKQLKKNPSIKFVLDIHRDAFLLEGGKKLKVCAEVDGEKVAQIMFVVGTDQWGSLQHPKWRENFKLGLKLQNYLNMNYPGLARPINLRKERFNQHVTTGSLLIEMGSNGNTLEEALASSKYLVNALSKIIKELD